MSVCPKNVWAAWRLQKWLDFAEAVHTLGTFSFFENFGFRGLGASFYSQNELILAKKTLGQAVIFPFFENFDFFRTLSRVFTAKKPFEQAVDCRQMVGFG